MLRLPLNALTLVGVVSFLLSIIYVISTTAFNAIISLQAMALSVSYTPPIFFLALRRIRRDPPQPGPFGLWPLRPCYQYLRPGLLVFTIIWLPFPQVLPVAKDNMNYADPLLGAVIVGALID
jgi:choline transport protein